MEQVFDARRNGDLDGTDARGIAVGGGTDARGINPEPQAPTCPECATPLRATGPGRRPVYCGRACSSKAYRRRRAEDQQDAVADALITSRVDIPAAPDTAAREFLELAAAVQRGAARYLQRLEQARQGGEDPGAGRALELLEANVTGATQRLLRQAHVLRFEMVSARGRAQREAAAAALADPAPIAAPAALSADSSRVETTGSADQVESSRVESTASVADVVPGGQRVVPDRPATFDAAPPVVPDPAAAPPGPRLVVSPRVETSGPALGTAQTLRPLAEPVRSAPAALHSAVPAAARLVQQPAPAAPVDPDGEQASVLPEQLQLALAAERTSVSPLARGLGAPSDSWRLPDSDLVVEGWAAAPDLFAVRGPNRQLVGWVARAGDAWGSYIDGSLVIDAVDGDPWLSRDATYAVSLLVAALDQQRA
ncbi:hypothetical protein AB0D10_39930 [Kitasatospora sp. NPDC048545]|uniref:hypothetical protein n=1 Tax=Kitasatospora sp. NPDC048545 TaxID=3157208 RepID=UPI0033F9D0A3